MVETTIPAIITSVVRDRAALEDMVLPPALDQMLYERDTLGVRIGNGVSVYADLPYWIPGRIIKSIADWSTDTTVYPASLRLQSPPASSTALAPMKIADGVHAWADLPYTEGAQTDETTWGYTPAGSFTASELLVANSLVQKIGTYTSSAQSGLHVGLSAQDVVAAFVAQSLVPTDYGIVIGIADGVPVIDWAQLTMFVIRSIDLRLRILEDALL